MKIEKMDIELLQHPEKNIRIHTEKQIVEFVRSIEMFGQIRPVVIDENNTILAGNGLVMALREIGKTEADVLRIPNLTENQKKKLMIADNKIYDLGVNDLDTLYSFLEDLKYDLDIPGFDQDVLEAMVGDEEEITEMIVNYGKIDEEEKEDLEIDSEKKEKAIENFAEEKGIDVEKDNAGTYRMHIKCPKCGEIIWL